MDLFLIFKLSDFSDLHRLFFEVDTNEKIEPFASWRLCGYFFAFGFLFFLTKHLFPDLTSVATLRSASASMGALWMLYENYRFIFYLPGRRH
jgi:hypothetical protein